MMQPKNIIGQKYGRLTVVEEMTSIVVKLEKRNQRYRIFKCSCICGTIKEVRMGTLKYISSCGCMHKEITSKINFKHGLYNTRLYSIWQNMKARCSNPNNPKFHIYGGKGITICKEWLSIENFYSWSMSNGYNEKLTIDRINSSLSYSPENCRWASHKEQNRNISSNVTYTHNGRTQILSDWAFELNISANALKKRIRKWTIEKALTEPVNISCRRIRKCS